ncbi:unnamed protein product, partial [marine sediment metagenome]
MRFHQPATNQLIWCGKVGDGVRVWSVIPFTISVEAVVQTMAELRLLGCADLVYMKGYYTPGDGGSGHFYFDNASTDPDDGGMTILPTGEMGAGRWKRIVHDYVTVDYFGAIGDGATDSTVPFQSALDCGIGNVVIPVSSYVIDGGLVGGAAGIISALTVALYQLSP